MTPVHWKTADWKRKFILLWTGQAVSIFTSSVIQMAIIWYLTEKTKSAAILSLATMVGFLPQAVMGPFIGVLIDRYNRKTIMILSDTFIASVTLLLVFAGFYGEIPIWLIMMVLFARSIGTAFHEPSLQAVTPLLVPKENLTKCAGYSQTFESVSLLLSPAVAAVLYGVWSLNVIILLDVAGAIFAVFTLCVIKLPSLIKAEEIQAPNLIREAKEGLAVLRKERGMMGLMLIGAFYAVIYMPIGTLYPLICMSYFKGTFVESGIVEIMFASGTLLGSVALGIWGDKIDKIGTIAKSIGGMGVGLVIAGLLPPSGFKAFAVLAAVMGATTPFYWGVQTAVFQLKIKPEYLGRVLSLSSSLALVSMPLGLGLSGTFAEAIGVEKWFFISGISAVVLALVCIMLPSLRNCCKSEER
jgi:MFS transporter, DHA3 family, macrolide efflux protein